MARTPFIETEALLLASEDAEADSGAYTVDGYLEAEFSEHELRLLIAAADLLSDRAEAVLRQKRKERRG